MRTFCAEREASTADAIAYAQLFIKSSSLSLEVRSVGRRVITTECRLVAPGGFSTVGRGKGVGQQSLASALFEALEHFYYEIEVKPIFAESFDPFSSRHNAAYAHASPDMSLFFSSGPAPLSVLRFKGIGIDDELIFPAILTDPKFRAPSAQENTFILQSGIYKYSSNSGTASGISRAEATLHGVLELIERDALGLAFVTSTLRRDPLPLRRFRPGTFPDELRSLQAEIESESGGAITTWDIACDTGIPVALCRLTIGRNSFFGSGASLRASYAVERAMLEALQVYHIQERFGPWLQMAKPCDPDRASLFQRCNLEGGVFLYRGGEIDVSFREEACVRNQNLEDQLRHIVVSLEAADVKVYARDIFADGLAVVQVVSPTLERCHLLSHGLPVAPGFRAKSVANRPKVGVWKH